MNFIGFIDNKSLNSIFFGLAIFLVGLTIMDTSMTKILALYPINQFIPNFSSSFFIMETLIIIISQNIILYFIWNKMRDNFAVHVLRNKFIFYLGFQTALTILMIFVIAEFGLYNKYSSFPFFIILNTSYIISFIFLILLFRLFIKWYLLNKIKVLLFYTISVSILLIDTILNLILIDKSLWNFPVYVYPHESLSWVPFLVSDSIFKTVNYLISYFTIGAFVSWWISSLLLIFHYSQRIGHAKFWMLMAIPLVFFLIPFIPNLIYIIPNNLLYLYFTITSFNNTIGAILFGLSFYIIVRKFDRDNLLKKYLFLSGIGLTLIFISNQSLVILNIPYPPYGLAGVSIISFGNLLLLYGISFSAIHLSYNTQMRKHLEKFAKEEIESAFLSEISRSEVLSSMESKVNHVSKKYLDELNSTMNFKNSYLDEESIKNYVNEIIMEIELIDRDKNYKKKD